MSKENRYLIHVHYAKASKQASNQSTSCAVTDTGLDIAATGVAVTRVRSARAARVVAVTGAVDFALNDDAVTAVAVMTGDEECQQAGDEEEDAIPG